jgi:ribulose-phosphate 3-epimerase
MEVRINPSILAADFVNLQDELVSINSADYVHVDVMDNHFVPNLTFGQQMVARIQEVSLIPLDVHLMIENVDSWGLEFAKLGVASVTFHLEASNDPLKLAAEIRALGSRAGIAIKPQTPSSFVEQNLASFDQVLVMTVEPGFGGQKFMSQPLEKVSTIRRSIDDQRVATWLQVDGGVDAETIVSAARAGADTFVAGSAIFRDKNRGAEITKLRGLAQAAFSATFQ